MVLITLLTKRELMNITKETFIQTFKLLAAKLDSMNISHTINEDTLFGLKNSLDDGEIHEYQEMITIADKEFFIELMTEYEHEDHLVIVLYCWFLQRDDDEDCEEICIGDMNDESIQQAVDEIKSYLERT
jgi:hypothetical protein